MTAPPRGLTTGEAAARLGVTVQTMRQRASRARIQGDDWRLPRAEWLYPTIPMYDPNKLPTTERTTTP